MRKGQQLWVSGRVGTINDKKLLVPGADFVGQPMVDTSNRLVLCQGKGALCTFDLMSGERRWQVPLKRFGTCSGAEKDEIAHLGDDNGDLTAVRMADGKVIWATNFNRAPEATGAPTVFERDGEGLHLDDLVRIRANFSAAVTTTFEFSVLTSALLPRMPFGVHAKSASQAY